MKPGLDIYPRREGFEISKREYQPGAWLSFAASISKNKPVCGFIIHPIRRKGGKITALVYAGIDNADGTIFFNCRGILRGPSPECVGCSSRGICIDEAAEKNAVLNTWFHG
jgi:hypothetical protein